jgi:hypothetical protein
MYNVFIDQGTIMKPLTKFQMWILRKVFKAAMIQSSYHQRNLVTIQILLLEVMRAEFYEDNDATLDYFVRDCYIEAKATVLPYAIKPQFALGSV